MAGTINIATSGKRKSSITYGECVLCFSNYTKQNSGKRITPERWSRIKVQAEKWNTLDKFGSLFTSVDWDAGSDGKSMHKSCELDLFNVKKLDQASKRQENEKKLVEEPVKQISTPSESTFDPPQPKRLRSEGKLHDKNLCIWCMKPACTKKKNNLRLMTRDDAWYTFKVHVEFIDDEMLKDRLKRFLDVTADPFAVEIRYCKECWNNYISHNKGLVSEYEYSSRPGIDHIKNLYYRHIHYTIFEEHEIRTLQSLRNDYVRMLRNYGFDSNVKSSYVKDMLTKEFQDSIGFIANARKNVSELVYDTKGGRSYAEAIITSSGLSNEQLIRNTAVRLHKEVTAVPDIPFPPFLSDLEKNEDISPLLLWFLTWLKDPSCESMDCSAGILSLASFLTGYMKNKPTLTAINLSVIAYGLTKNKELIKYLHKHKVGISYKMLLRLRDFWTYTDLINSHFCPIEISGEVPCVVVVDNDDFKSDTLTGDATAAHRTNVMFIQPENLEVKPDDNIERNVDKSVMTKTIEQSTDDYNKLSTFKACQRIKLPTREKQTNPDLFEKDISNQRTKAVIHTLVRRDASGNRFLPEEQRIPSYSGFQASISETMQKSKAYYHHTYPQPPSKAVCYDILYKLSKMIKEKNIPFVVLVGDYPVYALFLELKTTYTVLFANIIPHLGPFHMQMSFLAAINKRFKGSGISEVLVAAGVIQSGSVDQAMKGKHFNRIIRCHSLMRETLLEFLIQELSFKTSNEEKEKIINLRNTECSSADREQDHDELQGMIHIHVQQMFEEAKEKSDMARYWVSYIDMVDILLMNVHACRTVDWSCFLSSMYMMLPWMKIYDNDKYARLLPDHWAYLCSLPDMQFVFLSKHFSQSLSGNPHSGMPLDMWIECTMNLKSKSKSGWHHILQNKKELMVSIHFSNHFGRIREKIRRHTGLKKRKSSHKECAPSRRRKDERAIQDLLDCCREFECNPFDEVNGNLRNLESGLEASSKLIKDFESAHEDGKSQVEEFLNKRVYSDEMSIYDVMKRNSRLNFAKTKEGKQVSAVISTKEMENEGLGVVIDLLNDSSMHEIFEYRITSESLPTFNPNGTFRKCQKSKLLQCMDVQKGNIDDDYLAIVDMGMIIRKAIPNQDQRFKEDGQEYVWNDYVEHCVDMIFRRHNRASTIICVNDPYGREDSIKYEERERRSNGEKVANVHAKLSDKFPTSKQFTNILKSDSNKSRIQSLLKNSLARSEDDGVKVLYVLDTCIDLSDGSEISDFNCSQAEADTMMLFIYAQLRTQGLDKLVVLDSEDTDVYVQAAYVARDLPGLKIYKNTVENNYVDCEQLCSSEMADVIIQLHVLTGCDSNSAFFGHGKKKIFDNVQSNEQARQLLKSCGVSLYVNDSTMNKLTKFVLQYIYNDRESKNCTEARVKKWKSFKKKKSLARLPPDEDSLIHHIRRSNYLAYIQRNYALSHHPTPIGKGWKLVNGKCYAERHTKQNAPREVTIDPVSSDNSDIESTDLSASEKSDNETDCDV